MSLNDKLNIFIERLYTNQNNTETEHLKNVYQKENYYKLLEDVMFLLEHYPNMDMTFYREHLIELSGIKEIIHNFIEERRLTPGMTVSFGTQNNVVKLISGNKQEVIMENGTYCNQPIEMTEHDIFDLASTSKLFTAISLLKLCEAGLININDPIRKYVPEFENLEDITIFDLMTFQVPVKSEQRIDMATSIQEAEKLIYTMFREENHNPSFPYTDMGSITLRFVIEKVSNMPLREFIEEEIIKKYNMTSTFLNVPEELRSYVVNENYSAVVDKDGRILTIKDNIPGTVHDAKTRKLGHSAGIAPGHAGFFSCADDLQKLAQCIMNKKVLNEEHTLMLGQNVVGKKILYEGGLHAYNCHHGLLTYAKQADPYFLSTVRPFLSGKAFASPGFTGTSLCVDSLNGVYTFISSNRLHNRIYTVHPDQRHNIIVHDNRSREFVSPFTGETKIIASSYAHDSAEITEIAMKLALEFKFLEEILEQKNELKLVRYI